MAKGIAQEGAGESDDRLRIRLVANAADCVQLIARFGLR